MKKKLSPGQRIGDVSVPTSKSHLHRLLICKALSQSESPSRICCRGMSGDIEATIGCLKALGADISAEDGFITVGCIKKSNSKQKHLYCGESGSTLRFLVPVVGALGENAVFHMEGRLPERPMEPLIDVLSEHGMSFSKEGGLLYCEGKLTSGLYKIRGDISSQFISGLLFALPLLDSDSVIMTDRKPESLSYIEMTEKVLEQSGIRIKKTELHDNGSIIFAPQKYRSAETVHAEADWSGAAAFLCMGAFSESGIRVHGLSVDSIQGDKAILDILKDFGAEVNIDDEYIKVKKKALKAITVDASDIPDLVPVISAVAAGADGETKIINASRLRLKESDRLKTTAAVLTGLGADVKETNDGLIIKGKTRLQGGKAQSFGDHRIAMTAAVASLICEKSVTVIDAECTDKSFPGFWEEFGALEVR